MFRYLAADPAISLTVFFLTDLSAGPHYDAGFATKLRWDIPLGGYPHRFLSAADHAHPLSFWRPSVGGLWRLLASGGFDALWVHGYAHQALLRAIMYARLNGVSVVLRGDTRLGPPQPALVKRGVKRTLLPRLFKLFDAFLAIGSSNRDHYRYHGVADHRIFMTPYAVDNHFFAERAAAASLHRDSFRSALGLAKGHPIILFVGKLQRLKGVHDLLEAFVRIAPDCRRAPPYLLFVGDGEERTALEARVRLLRTDYVRFIGFKNQTQLPAYYDLCDLFVLPSANEAWGLVLNEVMNAGKPVIASDRVGAARDLIREGVNGFVFPAGQVAALSERITAVLARPATAARMGLVSRQIVSGWNFEADRIGLIEALAYLKSVKRRKTSLFA